MTTKAKNSKVKVNPDNLPEKQELTKHEALALNYIIYGNKAEAGRKAGLSESYIKTTPFYNNFKHPDFIKTYERMIRVYGLVEQLPKYLKIQNQALDNAIADPEKAIENLSKLTHIPKQFTKHDVDTVPQQVTINIQQAIGDFWQSREPKPVKAQDVDEAEVIDNGK